MLGSPQVLKNPSILIECTSFLLAQIYVDDIIFGGSSHVLVSGFLEMMEKDVTPTFCK
jgi:hypothetical protein